MYKRILQTEIDQAALTAAANNPLIAIRADRQGNSNTFVIEGPEIERSIIDALVVLFAID